MRTAVLQTTMNALSTITSELTSGAVKVMLFCGKQSMDGRMMYMNVGFTRSGRGIRADFAGEVTVDHACDTIVRQGHSSTPAFLYMNLDDNGDLASFIEALDTSLAACVRDLAAKNILPAGTTYSPLCYVSTDADGVMQRTVRMKLDFATWALNHPVRDIRGKVKTEISVNGTPVTEDGAHVSTTIRGGVEAHVEFCISSIVLSRQFTISSVRAALLATKVSIGDAPAAIDEAEIDH